MRNPVRWSFDIPAYGSFISYRVQMGGESTKSDFGTREFNNSRGFKGLRGKLRRCFLSLSAAVVSFVLTNNFHVHSFAENNFPLCEMFDIFRLE